MSQYGTNTQTFNRYSRDGFQQLKDSGLTIPMQAVHPVSSSPAAPMNEKYGLSNRRSAGFRQSFKPSRNPGPLKHGPVIMFDNDEEGAMTKMGQFYTKFYNFSVVTRYLVYVVPVAIILCIPIIIGATAAPNATLGNVPITWFFAWILVSWTGLWASKLVAHFLPRVFQAVCGVVSSGTRKYASVLASLQIPLSLVGWALVSLSTFMPMMVRNPYRRAHPFANGNPRWMTIMNDILAATLIGTIIFLLERIFIQLISINYHRRQFMERIKESKHNIQVLGSLYEASRTMFPTDCPEFAEEDAIIANSIDLTKFGHQRKVSKTRYNRTGAATPMRMMREMGNFGNKLTAALGNVATEVTGKTMFDGNSAHSVVVEALERNRSAEALARRIWLSFVIEGNEALFLEDIVEVLGDGRQTEAEAAFASLDRDVNGDVSLDEMILTVTEYGRERYAIANSMHDVDQAINVLDRLLMALVFVAVIFIFVAFLNKNLVTTLATAGTALLSLSFVFSVTAQEVLGSCIFLFVKHPFDIGDRVDISKDMLVVEHISLLFTAFRRVTNHQMVQIPNIVLNTLWIENVSRSKAQREQVSAFVDFSTSFEDIQTLKSELQRFVTDKDNSRDFQPDVDVQVLSIAEMNKLELQINVIHKSNWSNETVRAARRSKLMCALLAAIRRVPIKPPGGGGPSLGDPNNPSYTVAITDERAASNKAELAEKNEAARLVPSKTSEPTWIDQLHPHNEQKAMNLLNERPANIDGNRDADDAVGRPELDGSDIGGGASGNRSSIDPETLTRQKSRGRRKSGRTHSTKSIGASTIASIHRGSQPEVPRIDLTMPPPALNMGGNTYAPMPPRSPTVPTRPARQDNWLGDGNGSAHGGSNAGGSTGGNRDRDSYESLHAVPVRPPNSRYQPPTWQ